MQVLLDDYSDGAALATELVNSGPDVQSRGDRLPDLAAVLRLLAGHGVQLPDLGDADLGGVHDLRRRLRGLVTADDPVPGVNELVAAVAEGPRLHAGADDRWHWAVRARPGAGPVERLALVTGVGLLAALATLGPDRFRDCAAPDCAGVFVDTSRAGRRRYCEPTVCGNRVNVAAYRARRRG
jgi:hypothetical protein